MHKIIKHWDIYISTKEMQQGGKEPMLVGAQMDPQPKIEHGFLRFQNIYGAEVGVNLNDITCYSIEPVYKEDE